MEEKIRENIAKNIKYCRKKNGLTQEQLGEYLDIAKEQVSYIETGKRPIDVIKLNKICELFDVQMDIFLNEELGTEVDISHSFRTKDVDRNTLEAIAFLNEFAKNFLRLKSLE